MKYVILISVFLFQVCLFAQTSGTVHYSVVLNKNSPYAITYYTKKHFYEGLSNSKFVTFELLFNKDSALFTMKPTENISVSGSNALKAMTSCLGKVYQDTKAIYELQEELFQEKYLVKYEVNKLWKLTKESKIILGYTCYKATSFDVEEGKATNKKVTAWYCPNIPVPFGPNNYTGLPGLVLELENVNCTFTATTIDLKAKVTAIKKPAGIKEINEKQFIEMLDEKMIGE
jgi:GLPGLI family protein